MSDRMPRAPEKTPPLGVPAVRSPTPTSSPAMGALPVPTSSPATRALDTGGSSPSISALQAPPSLPYPGVYPQGPPSVAPASVQFPQIGSVLSSRRGSYVIHAVLGTGEFGAVYEAVGPFDQIYAVKMIRPALRPYADVQAEWVRETQRLMSLRHPNVVYIFDAFEENHLFYVALERCDHSLHAMLGAPLQEGLILELTRQICAAVQFLHDNDFVHDDLHGGNVLITQAADRPIVKISDFGISHELRGAAAVRPNVVHHAIMAPEILATGYTSKQSDLYQIGLLLYWMVTGHPALSPSLPYADLVHLVAAGEPRRRAEQLGTPLGALIAKLPRRRDTYRYTSAREVWDELRLLPAWQQRQLFPVK